MTRGRTARPIPHLRAPELAGELTERGVSPDRLRAHDLDRSVWGVRAREGAYGDLAGRCRMFAARMPPEAFFSHITAARLHGLPVPLRHERDTRLHTSMPAPHRAPHARGIAGHQLRIGPDDVNEMDGLRVTSPARTFRDLASMLAVAELVAVGDRIIHWRHRLATPAELAASAGGPIRGIRTLRAALGMLDERAESPKESELRAILLIAGLPRPEANFEVVDRATGMRFRIDLAYPAPRLAIEYQGDYHREPGQWRADMTRRRRLEAMGWAVLEVNADDLRRPIELVDAIRRNLDAPRVAHFRGK